MKKKILKKDEGLAFPRYEKKGKSKPKIVEKEKKHIQPAVDEYLEYMKSLHHIEVIRIPDLVYGAIKNSRQLPEWAKKKALAALKSIPDNVIIKKGKDNYNECLCLELKTEGNDLSQGQRKFAKNVNVIVTKSIHTSVDEINKFLEI